jgi:hypothetical protein
MPALVTISMVRDEADVIATWARWHARRASRMLVTLHRSQDATRPILESLRAEGLPLDIRMSDVPRYAQAEILNGLLREAAALGDWVLPLDADEFLVGETDVLAMLDPSRPWLLPWKTYVPMPDGPADGDILTRMTRRRRTERPQFHKVLVPAALARTGTLGMGSHLLRDAAGTPLRADPAPGLALAHFPVRAERQLRRKVIAGWESHLQNPHRESGQIFQWEALYARCRDPRPIDGDELRAIALHYAVPAGTEADEAIVEDPVR